MNKQNNFNFNYDLCQEEPMTLIDVIESLEKLNGGHMGCFGSEAQRLYAIHGILIQNSINNLFSKGCKK